MAAGAVEMLLQLLVATIDGAAECVSPEIEAASARAAAIAAGSSGGENTGGSPLVGGLVQPPGPDPPLVYCCSTAVWAIGMMVREQPDAVGRLEQGGCKVFWRLNTRI